MYGLFKEVFSKYRGEFIESRKKLGLKRNLFLFPFLIALVVLFILILKIIF